jgi:lysophospholipase L1-like esterase
MKAIKNTLLCMICILLAGFTQKEERILFIGDSLTCYSGGWQHQLSRMLQMKYDNISKGGKRTKWMLERFKEHLNTNKKYTKVVIYGGINDSFSSVREDDTIENIQKMVDMAKQIGAEPIVVVGYDPTKVVVRTIYSDNIESRCRNRYISLQKRIVKDIKGCKIVPMESGVGIDRSDSDDGIHLRGSGHRKFMHWVLAHI